MFSIYLPKLTKIGKIIFGGKMSYYSYEFEEGATLLIELNSGEIYEAEFECGNPDFVTVRNVSLYPSKSKQNFCYKFYKSEIITINVEVESARPKEQEAAALPPEQTPVMLFDEYEELKQKANKYVYISTVDDHFLQVIEYLKQLHYIAVFGEGSQYGRLVQINLLIVGTRSTAYIFDIKIVGCEAFNMGLKQILEDNDILKIVHNSRSLADCLQYQHSVHLQNIFDTQVADYRLLKRDTIRNQSLDRMRTFAELVKDYLNLPADVIENYEISCKHLAERPLLENVKLKMALKVAYLFHMRIIMDEKLFYEYHLYTQCFLNSMRDKDQETVSQTLFDEVPEEFSSLNIKL